MWVGLLLACVAICSAANPWDPFTYTQFTEADADDFITANGPAIVNNRWQFTNYNDTATTNTARTVRYGLPVSVRGFQVSFTLLIRDSGALEGNGHEGMAFIMDSDETGNGQAGGALGYATWQSSAGISNNLAIEFDTFQTTEFNDPANDHISIHTMGSQPNSGVESGLANNGPSWGCNYELAVINSVNQPGGVQPFSATIKYEPPYAWAPQGTKGSFSVFTTFETPTFFCNTFSLDEKLTLMSNGTLYIGFSASTALSGLFDTQELLSWSYQFLGFANANTSTAVVPAQAVAGVVTTITITSFDQYGNPFLSGGAQVRASSGTLGTWTPVVDNLDGTYTTTVSYQLAGPKTITITLNGFAIVGSPFTMSIVPGPIAYANSQVSVLTASAVAGQQLQYTIQTRDQYGNNLLTTTAMANFAVNPAGNVEQPSPPCTAAAGLLTCSYTVTSAYPTYSSSITLDGHNNFARSVQNFAITNAPYTPGSPIVIDLVDLTPSVGETSTFVVATYDKYGNPLLIGPWPSVVATSNPAIPGIGVENPSPGNYTVSYMPQTVEIYEITITIDGAAAGSVTIDAMTNLPPVPDMTEISGPGLVGMVVGGNTFTVVPRDKFANLVRPQTVQLTVNFTSGGNSFNANVTQLHEAATSSWIVTYDITVSGTYALNVFINEQPMPESPYTIVVAPGVGYGPSSSASGSGLSKGLTNELESFVINTYDRYGNARTMGDSNVTVQIATDAGSTAGITILPTENYNNGSYGVSYTAAETGDYDVTITLNGAPIQGSPFQLHIAWAKTLEVILIVVGVVGAIAIVAFVIAFWRIRRKKKGYVRF